MHSNCKFAQSCTARVISAGSEAQTCEWRAQRCIDFQWNHIAALRFCDALLRRVMAVRKLVHTAACK